MNDRIRVLQRQPRRVSITLSYQVHEALLTRSEEEGRSLSNLCAFLLEDSLREPGRLIVDSGSSNHVNAPRFDAQHSRFDGHAAVVRDGRGRPGSHH
jgi:hypothetical protein